MSIRRRVFPTLSTHVVGSLSKTEAAGRRSRRPTAPGAKTERSEDTGVALEGRGAKRRGPRRPSRASGTKTERSENTGVALDDRGRRPRVEKTEPRLRH